MMNKSTANFLVDAVALAAIVQYGIEIRDVRQVIRSHRQP